MNLADLVKTHLRCMASLCGPPHVQLKSDPGPADPEAIVILECPVCGNQMHYRRRKLVDFLERISRWSKGQV